MFKIKMGARADPTESAAQFRLDNVWPGALDWVDLSANERRRWRKKERIDKEKNGDMD